MIEIASASFFLEILTDELEDEWDFSPREINKFEQNEDD